MSGKTIYLLCDDETQRNAIEQQLASEFEIAYAGTVADRPTPKPEIATMVDLTSCDTTALGDVFSEAVECVVNVEKLSELDDLAMLAWRRRVVSQICGDETVRGLPKQSNFWVLCSSTNGPNTVSEFLSAVPSDTGDSFILLQHIKEAFVKSLREMLMKATPMLVVASTRSERIKPNTIYICPPSRTPKVSDGRLFWEKKRSKKFNPCIDESLESLSVSLGHRMKVIVFTGMGTDCLMGCRRVIEAGGTVWAQSLDSATMDTMPRSVIDAGLTSEVGNVQALASAISCR